jgi:uncharacterized protein (DUF1697 family)
MRMPHGCGIVETVTTHIALLRAVNLGPHNKVAMADLRGLCEDLGFTDVRTLLQSGNVVFDGKPTGAELETLLETQARKRLGLDTDFMVRTAAQWKKIVAGNPFPREAKADPGHLVVMVCKQAPGKDVKITGAKREIVRAKGKEIYIVYPDGIGRSRLAIGAVGTGRNWNTVLKLAAVTTG